MDPNLRPEDAAAFERLLLASPNSSLLWLQYMAHHLQATQIEQARAVAERALKTISFRSLPEYYILITPMMIIIVISHSKTLNKYFYILFIIPYEEKWMLVLMSYHVAIHFLLLFVYVQDLTATAKVQSDPVLVQGGAGEAECVGGAAEPGEHVRHTGDPEESVWAGSAVLWAHARLPAAGRHLRQVRQDQGAVYFWAFTLLTHLKYCVLWLHCLCGCTQEAEGLYKTMVKRFRQNKAVWLSFGSFLLQQGQSDAAAALLQRALKSLPSKESK